MAQIKFYQNEDGVFFFGNRTANPGSIQLIRKSESTVNFQVNSSFDYFTEDLNIEDVLDKNGDPTYSSFEDIISKNKNFFLKAPASNGGGSTLDFLFVDAWFDENDGAPFNPTSANQFAISFLEDNWSLLISAFADESWGWTGYAGAGSDPYVPISKNTIFVHPTTFERYRFNGTTMEIYNDVNNVVPKWRTYKALLTQDGENAPVARVLNQDETDYLGDVIWMIDDVGSFYVYLGTKNDKLIMVSSSEIRTSLGEVRVTNDEQYVFLMTYGNDGQLSNGVLAGRTVSVEIKVRQRGASPVLLSAETNESGDKVILTFDKKMSEYGIKTCKDDYGKLGILRNPGGGCGYVDFSFIDDKTVEITSEEPISNGSNIVLVYPNALIESFDYGLLQPFENFPVVNKVV